MIKVSSRNFRYLENEKGEPFLPIGPNLAFVRFETDGERVLQRYDLWTRKLAENGANFFRVWLGAPAFNVEPGKCGEFSEEQAGRIRRLLDMAKERGLKVKLTIDHFRFIDPEPVAEKFAGSASFARPEYHVDRGGVARDMDDYLDGEAGRKHFLSKLDFLARHLAGHPAALAWELWNEMNAVKAKSWQQWTRDMLPELRKRFPDTVALQSLGSYDHANAAVNYQEYCERSGSDILQVHRYIDERERNFPECRGSADVMAGDALGRLRLHGTTAPLFLAEAGAVEPGHAGPFKLYGEDKDGTILHDVLFAGFFAGGAGPGHCWHWQDYIEPLDLWWHFGRFAKAVEGVDPIEERFEPVRWTRDGLRCWTLLGERTTIIWIRDTESDWRSELVEGRAPRMVEGARLELPKNLKGKWEGKAARSYDPWTEEEGELKKDGDGWRLPGFRRSLVARVVG